MSDLILTAAREALDAGLCVVPAARDGSKAPHPGGPKWEQYKTALPTLEDLDRWFTGTNAYPGLGLVCGAVSGGLEMLELEGVAVTEGMYDELLDRARHAGLLDLVDRISAGYEENTPSGGVHWLYRCDVVAGNMKLARRPNPDDGTVTVLIETRGEGGFTIVAPSAGTTHPTGQAWELVAGGFDQVVTITADERAQLHRLCATFDQMPVRPSAPAPARRDDSGGGEGRPGDDYNARTTWHDVLEPHGWTYLYPVGDEAHWRRPGKTTGLSATTNHLGTDRLKVFSSSTVFDTETTYDRFGAYAVLEHQGDLAAAARALRHDGFGEQASRSEPRAEGRPIPNEPDEPPPPDGTDRAPTDQPDRRPTIVVNGRPLRAIIRDLALAITKANTPPVVFMRAGQLTRVRRDEKGRPLVEAMSDTHLRHRVAALVDTVEIGAKDRERHVPPAHNFMRDLLALPTWNVPALEAVTEMPTLRPDGTIHAAPGYDPVTCLLHEPAPGLTVPPIPDNPSAEDIAAAVVLIDELLCDFPFDTQADKANAIGCLLSPVVRPAIDGQTPLALSEASEPGTGKSLFAKVVSIVATGRTASVKPLPEREEEIRKMITATLLEGSTMVVLDNVDDAIRSPSLAAALTSDVWSDRILGRSEVSQLPNRATWIATGNNIHVAGDLARRCYRIRLDARQAKPYTRTGFRHDDLEHWTVENRGRILAALLTLARAWYAAGKPDAAVPTMGGYTPWARTIGGILAHAGITGFLDNLLDFMANADQEANEWEGFLTAWAERWGTSVVTVNEVVVELASRGTVPLRDALPLEIAAVIERPTFQRKLGWALTKRKGRHHGDAGYHLIAHPKDRRKVALWSVGFNGSVIPDADVVPMHTLRRAIPDALDFGTPYKELDL